MSRMKASFIVSGSQDCTVKVWDLPADLSTTGGDIHQLTAHSTEKAHDKVRGRGKYCTQNKKNFNHVQLITCTKEAIHTDTPKYCVEITGFL